MTWTSENLRDNMLICAAQTQNQCKCSFSNSSLFAPLRLHPTLHFWKTITKESRWDVGAWWSTPWLQLRAQVSKLCTVSQRGIHVALSCAITSATNLIPVFFFLASHSSEVPRQLWLEHQDHLHPGNAWILHRYWPQHSGKLFRLGGSGGSEAATVDPVFPSSAGTAVMAIFPNVYVAMVMISSMGVISMSISYCPYALLGQYHEMKEVQIRADEIY